MNYNSIVTIHFFTDSFVISAIGIGIVVDVAIFNVLMVTKVFIATEIVVVDVLYIFHFTTVVDIIEIYIKAHVVDTNSNENEVYINIIVAVFVLVVNVFITTILSIGRITAVIIFDGIFMIDDSVFIVGVIFRHGLGVCVEEKVAGTLENEYVVGAKCGGNIRLGNRAKENGCMFSGLYLPRLH